MLSYFIDKLKSQIILKREEISIKNEKEIDINSKEDLIGIWKEIDCDFNNRFEAIIDKESITIYKYDNTINNLKHNVLYRNVYWAGIFDIDFDINEESRIISKNFNKITDRMNFEDKQIIDHSKEKSIVYSKGTIMFLSQYGDEYRYIILKRFDTKKRKPMSDLLELKYVGDRESKFDKGSNNRIDLGNYEIDIPSYFDNIESESLEKNYQLEIIPDSFKSNELGGQMYNERYIVRTPSDKNAYAELFIGKYINANLEDVNELKHYIDTYGAKQIDYDYYLGLKEEKKQVISDYIKVSSNSLDGSENFLSDYIYIHNYLDNRGDNPKLAKGLVYDTWIGFTDTNTVFCIGLAYGYNDISNNDYIEDYKKILNSLRRK